MTDPEFSLWARDTLEQFAEHALIKIKAQELEIQQLKADVKTALDAYRQSIKD
jgi:hypothetical protein